MTDTGHDEDPPSRRRRETRARLLDAAAEVFVEEGLQGASVEAVCSRAGFTRGAFYSNFSSKEELFLAALTRQYEQRAEQVHRRAEALVPQLRDRTGTLAPEEISRYAVELMLPISPGSGWFALETEFMLLAMRDLAPFAGFDDMLESLKCELVDIIEELVGAWGRRFTLPADRALAVFEGLHERALRHAALSGQSSEDALAELGDRITELLFAITEEVGPGEGGESAGGAVGEDAATQADRTPPADAGAREPGHSSWR